MKNPFKNPLKALDQSILTQRILWETIDTLPDPYRQRGIDSAPAALREDYLAARAADPERAAAAIAAARANPPRSSPAELSWGALLDRATM